MALSDKLNDLTKKDPTVCAYQSLFLGLSKEDQTALTEAWQKNIPARVVLQALRSEGYKTSNEAISNHRKGTCKCPKE